MGVALRDGHPPVEQTDRVTVEERTADFDLLTSVAPRRWAPAVFGVVPQGANRRRPSDFVRLGAAALVIVVTALGADDVGGLEKAIFDVLADLPSWIRSSAEVLYHVGSVGTVVVLALAFLFTRRFRLLLLLVGAGALGWAGERGPAGVGRRGGRAPRRRPHRARREPRVPGRSCSRSRRRCCWSRRRTCCGRRAGWWSRC